MSTSTVASGWSLSTFFLPRIPLTTAFARRPASSDLIVSPPLIFNSDLSVSSRSCTPCGSTSPTENVANSNLPRREIIFSVTPPRRPDIPLQMKHPSSSSAPVRARSDAPVPCLSRQNRHSRNPGGFSSTRDLTSRSPEELPHLSAFARLHHALRLPV